MSSCNTYPVNVPAISSGGPSVTCWLWTSEDCGLSDEGYQETLQTVYTPPNDGNTCVDTPPKLPLSYKQTISSMNCTGGRKYMINSC